MAQPASDLKKAVKLFNRWQFQESHDAFTRLAEEAEGRDRMLYEAIASVSAGFFRIWNKGGEPNAMVSYLQRGQELLASYTRSGGPAQVAEFSRGIEACLGESRRWLRGDEEIFNRDLIPRIDFISER